MNINGRGAARSGARTRAAGRRVAPGLDLKRARFGSVLPVLPPRGVQPHVPSAAI